MALIEGGKPEPLRKGEEVLVEDRKAIVICPSFATHVYRGMVSVDFGNGELDLVEEERVKRIGANVSGEHMEDCQ